MGIYILDTIKENREKHHEKTCEFQTLSIVYTFTLSQDVHLFKVSVHFGNWLIISSYLKLEEKRKHHNYWRFL